MQTITSYNESPEAIKASEITVTAIQDPQGRTMASGISAYGICPPSEQLAPQPTGAGKRKDTLSRKDMRLETARALVIDFNKEVDPDRRIKQALAIEKLTKVKIKRVRVGNASTDIFGK